MTIRDFENETNIFVLYLGNNWETVYVWTKSPQKYIKEVSGKTNILDFLKQELSEEEFLKVQQFYFENI